MKHNKFYNQNKEILKSHKTKCYFCGEKEKCCLEFHHIGPKLFNISLGAGWVTPNQLILELKRTICVCKNCHAKLHKGILKYENN